VVVPLKFATGSQAILSTVTRTKSSVNTVAVQKNENTVSVEHA
jgi:hypothetical protein